jgi:agmatine/peptidylarginine deiminase
MAPADVGYLLNRYYGFEQAIALEALAGEETAHVDLFAAFTTADTVVVGQYDPDVDRKNAELLDRNAERLGSITTSVGRLKVERIPMPTNAGGVWRSYTNVIFANGTLLVPVYNDVKDPGREQALETYARLLPGWEIKTIDATRLIRNRGALRCVSVNVPWLFEAFEMGHGKRVA